MRLLELLVETGNNPAPFHLVNPDDEVWEIRSPDIHLNLYILRTQNGRKFDQVVIEFTVGGNYNKTGTGNAVKIFSTVHAMLKKYLPAYIERSDNVVTFGAEKSEPSRVKLYNRVAPEISKILGPNWEYGAVDDKGSLKRYVWTRKKTKLEEKKVQSTWITDLRHSRDKKELRMTLNNGRSYLLPGVTRTVFDQWTRSPSKGKYFHSRIKGRYQVTRIK